MPSPRKGPARRPPTTRTCASCWRTSPSTPSRSPRPTTGTRWPRSGRSRRARTCTWRSRSATTCTRAACWSRHARKHDRIVPDRHPEPHDPANAAVHRVRPRGQAGQGHARRAGSATRSAAASARSRTARVPAGRGLRPVAGPGPGAAVPPRSFHYDWHWHWDYGNGDIANQGVHEMDKARWGLGKDDAAHVGRQPGRPLRLRGRRPDRPTPRSASSTTATPS